MKKSLVALAVLAASGAAFAQSSVTMYGVADLSLSDSSEAGKTAQMSGNGTMNNGSSRLGVRGTEDLGGGLKASFNFEQGINAETGATDAVTFQRAANMSLAGSFGSVRLGRGLTPSFFGVAAWELTGTANYSVVASQFDFAGGPSRNNSEFSYKTPDMGGFSGTLGYIAKADNLSAPKSANPNANPPTVLVPAIARSKIDANLIYAKGPVAVGLSYNKVQTLGKSWALGGKYDFGTFQVAASYQDPAGVKKGFTVGGSAALGPVVLTLDVARDTGSAVKSTDTVLEAKYALSKRTFAYAAVMRNGDGTPAVLPVAGTAATLGTTTVAGTAAIAAIPSVLAVPANTAYGIGIRHNF